MNCSGFTAITLWVKHKYCSPVYVSGLYYKHIFLNSEYKEFWKLISNREKDSRSWNSKRETWVELFQMTTFPSQIQNEKPWAQVPPEQALGNEINNLLWSLTDSITVYVNSEFQLWGPDIFRFPIPFPTQSPQTSL